MDWNEVKAKPKRKAKKPQQEDDGFYGAAASGGGLKAGPVGGSYSTGGASKPAANKQATNIADYDFIRDENEEIKYETVTHDCAAAVQAARLKKDWTQAQLAKAVNEKTGTIVDIENGTSHYDADIINRIEKALGVKIPRGRKSKKKKPTGYGF